MRDEGVLATLCLRVLRIRPSSHEVAVALHPGQLSCNGAIDGLCDVEVGREKDVKVSLMDLCFVSGILKLDGLKRGCLPMESRQVP